MTTSGVANGELFRQSDNSVSPNARNWDTDIIQLIKEMLQPIQIWYRTSWIGQKILGLVVRDFNVGTLWYIRGYKMDLSSFVWKQVHLYKEYSPRAINQPGQ